MCLQLPTVNNARDIKIMLPTLSDISLIWSFEETSSLDNFDFYNVESIHPSDIGVIFVGWNKNRHELPDFLTCPPALFER